MTITKEEFARHLPPAVTKNVNQEVLDKVEDLLLDQDMADAYRENLLSYASVMKTGRFKLVNYVDAVKYVSHKLMGKTNLLAYECTFPQKIADWNQRGLASKDINSYVTAYNKSKLVMGIFEQASISPWIANQDNYQKAINVQVEIMTSSKSDKVRSDAANSLLTHLKKPDAAKVELDVTIKNDSAIEALAMASKELVRMQRLNIESGSSTASDVARSTLVLESSEVELVE